MRFARAFTKDIGDVAGPKIDDWLRALRHDRAPVSGRTRNNLRTSLTTLFSFARQRGYVPKNVPTEAESVSKAKVVEAETQIPMLQEMRKILAAAEGHVRANIAIAGFAMLRTSEVARLDWEHIDLTENFYRQCRALQSLTPPPRASP